MKRMATEHIPKIYKIFNKNKNKYQADKKG
jgi:hypothetical protein